MEIYRRRLKNRKSVTDVHGKMREESLGIKDIWGEKEMEELNNITRTTEVIGNRKTGIPNMKQIIREQNNSSWQLFSARFLTTKIYCATVYVCNTMTRDAFARYTTVQDTTVHDTTVHDTTVHGYKILQQWLSELTGIPVGDCRTSNTLLGGSSVTEKSHIETFSCNIFGSFWDMFTFENRATRVRSFCCGI